MTIRYRTIGFVFKKNDVNESDRVFSIFTKDFGRLEITARAIRKITSKLRADIDIFCLSEIEFIQGKNNKTLTDAIRLWKISAESLKRFQIAFRVAFTLDNFIKGQEKDKTMFDFLNDFFEKLKNQQATTENQRLLFFYFFWNFTSLQGYHIEVQNCVVCKAKINPYNIYFSNKEGGIICKKCLSHDREAKKINSDIVKVLRLIFNKDWNTVSRLKIGVPSQNLLEEVSENSLLAFRPS